MDESLKELALDSLKKFFGLPPYNTASNLLKGDRHLLKAMERMYRLPLHRLEQETGFDKVRSGREEPRQRFAPEVALSGARTGEPNGRG
jgi:hypothetical protein